MRSFIKRLAILAGLAPAMVMAQGSPMDTDGDGLVSFDEVVALHPDVTSDAFLTADQNGDQMLDGAELAAAQEAGLIPITEG